MSWASHACLKALTADGQVRDAAPIIQRVVNT
jgi:hypothetical protein